MAAKGWRSRSSTTRPAPSGRGTATDGFHSASTIKVAILYAVFGAVDAGRFTLDAPLHVRNRFFSIAAPSLLDLPDRPPEYEDVGRRCAWQPFYPDAVLERSRFERVVINTLAREKLRLDGDAYTPTGMQGWSRVVFRRDSDGERRIMHIEDLLEHLQARGATGADSSR